MQRWIACAALVVLTIGCLPTTPPPTVARRPDSDSLLDPARVAARHRLRDDAAVRTSTGKRLLALALDTTDDKGKVELVERALGEYRLAATGWNAYVNEDAKAADAYDGRFWLADALHEQVRIPLLLQKWAKDSHLGPTQKDIGAAKAAAILARDSVGGDRYVQPAAQLVVEESDLSVDLDYERYAESKGSEGYPERQSIEMEGPADHSHVKVVPIPPNVLAKLKARDDYAARVAAAKDVADASGVKKATVLLFEAANTYYVYGDFANARARFEPIYKDHCGSDEYGQKAWEKLISIAAKSSDSVRARQLAEADKAHSCAIGGRKSCIKRADCGTDEDCVDNACRSSLGLEIGQIADYQDGDKAFIDACGRDIARATDKCDPVTDAKKPQWLAAAKLYNDALVAAPGRREAPRAAMRAAYSYKQLNDFSSAIRAYDLFIAEYGKEDTLKTLHDGDAKKGLAPDDKQYQERLKYLNLAYEELGTTYYGFFNYQKTAETYERVAQFQGFAEDERKTAAKNAMILDNAQALRDRMLAVYKIVTGLKPSADERANYDYLVASYDYVQYSPASGDAQRRLAAQQAMQQFYASHKTNPAAAKYSLEAAWRAAKLMKSANDTAYHTWFANTKAAWDFMNAHVSTTKDGKESDLPPYTDYGAEAEFTLLDEEIHDNFDNETGHHNYSSMNVEQILGKIDPKTGAIVREGAYRADLKAADEYDLRLKHVTDTYHSEEFVAASLARRGTLYDSLRSALYLCAGPAFTSHLLPAKFMALIQQMNATVPQPPNIYQAVLNGWVNERAREMEVSDEIMVRYYAQAAYLAQIHSVQTPAVSKAVAKLELYSDPKTELGEGPHSCSPTTPNGAPRAHKQCGIAPYHDATIDPTDRAGVRKLASVAPYTPHFYAALHSGRPWVLPDGGLAPPRPPMPSPTPGP